MVCRGAAFGPQPGGPAGAVPRSRQRDRPQAVAPFRPAARRVARGRYRAARRR